MSIKSVKKREAARHKAAVALARLNGEVERICGLQPGVHFIAARQASLSDYGDSDLVSSNDAARLLGLRRKTVENWRTAGRGPKHLKIGGKVLYRAGELRSYLDAAQRQSTSDVGGAE